MRFFVTEISSTEGGTASAVHSALSLDNAKMLYHQILASAYANVNVYYALVTIMDEFGNIIEKDRFSRDLPTA